MSADDELTRLRRENRALRDELEAWRANERDRRLTSEENAVVGGLCVSFAVSRGRARLLLELLKRRGLVIDHERLQRAACRTDDQLDPHNTLTTQICHLRRALARAGLPDAIRCVWASGYLITREAAAAIDTALDGYWARAA